MNEEMKFPETLDEFIKQYSFIDNKQFYTNGSELIQTFRIKQWEEHKEKENKQLKERLERIDNYLNKNYTAENQYWFDHIRDIVEDR